MAEDDELESELQRPDGEPAKPPSETPGLIQKIEWYLSHWREHKLAILIAILVTVVVLAPKEWQWINALLVAQRAVALGKGSVNISERVVGGAVDATLLQLAKKMKDDFDDARGVLERSGSADFSNVEKEIGALLALDAENGHGLYYREEVRRLSDQKRFNAKSCGRMPLAENTTLPDAYHNDFNRYLDNARSLPDAEAGGKTSRKACYERARGYCPQRTAWIEHLLANDLYAEGLASTSQSTRSTKFEEALGHAEIAMKLYPKEASKPFDGFDQCVATEDLKKAIIGGSAGVR